MTRLSSTCSQIIGFDSDSPQTVPGWSGFNVIIHEHDISSHSIIGYLPVINASPTKLATVCKLLKQCIAKADRIHQESAIVTLDQAIYANAKEIV